MGAKRIFQILLGPHAPWLLPDVFGKSGRKPGALGAWGGLAMVSAWIFVMKCVLLALEFDCMDSMLVCSSRNQSKLSHCTRVVALSCFCWGWTQSLWTVCFRPSADVMQQVWISVPSFRIMIWDVGLPLDAQSCTIGCLELFVDTIRGEGQITSWKFHGISNCNFIYLIGNSMEIPYTTSENALRNVQNARKTALRLGRIRALKMRTMFFVWFDLQGMYLMYVCM